MALLRELQRLNLWLACGAALSLLAWLLPHHGRPWTSFYNEWAMAAALWPLGAWLLLRWRMAVPLPAATLVLAALAAVPLAQRAGGLIEAAGTAPLVASILLATAASVALGRLWAHHARDEAHATLWTSLLAAGLLSAGLALAQWQRLDHFGVLLADLPLGAQATGNIAQANHLASLLAWSLLALWALALRGRVRPALAVAAALLLLAAAAASQSRTVWMHLGLMAVAAAAWRRHLVPGRRAAAGLALLVVAFGLMVASWPELSRALHLEPGRGAEAVASTGLRPGIWRLGLAALAEAPLQGWGWTQFSLAQVSLALALPPLQRPITYAHNLVLDLMVWNGACLGGLLALGLAGWVARRVWRVAHAPGALLALGLGTFLLHAQLEMPHAYLYFLLPAGLMAGMLLAQEEDSRPRSGPVLRLPWAAAAALWLAAAAVLAATWHDYRAIETRLEQERYRGARVGAPAAGPEASPRWLRQFDDLWPALRVDAQAAVRPEDLPVLQRAARQHPSGPLQYRLARAQAWMGQPQEARRTLALLCAMQTARTCEQAVAAWRAQALAEPPLQAVALPATGAPRADR